MMNKVGTIRTCKTRDCPFSLPIPKACAVVGESVLRMKVGERNKFRNHKTRCIFAEQLNAKMGWVNCDYGEVGAGTREPPLAHGSPIYPKLWEGFNTINLDRSYHNYRDFSYFSLYGTLSSKGLHKVSRLSKRDKK